MIPLAHRMDRMQRSIIREILKIAARPDVISFAGGLPDPKLFPLNAFKQAMNNAFDIHQASCLQYDVTEGYRPLKEWMCNWLKPQGIQATAEEMMFTSGSQQALDLIGKVFLNPGDAILVENPTYLGAIQAFNAYEPVYFTVPLESDGIHIEKTEALLKKSRPKFAYLVPTFQNPSGVTMSLKKRQAFIRLMQQYNIPIVEDDPYGLLRFREKPLPSLYELAGGKQVLYLSTFSKILSPGIRLGYVVGESDLLAPLVLAKQAADLQPNTLIQRAVDQYARAGDLEKHIPLIVNAYREKATIMKSCIQTLFPKEVTWIDAEGGMFIWCALPESKSAEKLFETAIEQKVAFVIGSVFHAGGGGDNTFRLNFTNSTPEQIQEGMSRLAQAIKTHIRS